MLKSVKGVLKEKGNNYIVLLAGPFGLKVGVPRTVCDSLPKVGTDVELQTYLHVREDGSNLYGFLTDEELNFFETLLSVSGIGPKIAMAVMSVAPINKLSAAISQGDADLLQKSFGIGKKTAERIVVELKDKISVDAGGEIVKAMGGDNDVLEALTSLGYTRAQAKSALAKVGDNVKETKDRLREALKIIKG